MKRRLIAALALVALLVPPVLLQAQPATDDAARAAYEQGEAAFGTGDYAGALQAWERAWDLSGRPALLYNLALAAEAAGEFARAVEYLDHYVDIGENVDLPAITEWIAVLRAQIPAEVADGSGADVSPTEVVVVEESPPPADGSGVAEGSGDTLAAPSAPVQPPAPEPDRRAFGGLEATLTGLSASSLVAAIALGVTTRRLGDGLESTCANDDGDWICLDDDRSRVNRERRMGVAADVAIGVSALSAVGLVVALLVDRDEGGVEVGIAPFGDGARVNVGGRF